MTESIKLFENKKECCACGACMNVCPNDAISMKEDEYGFFYPIINDQKCIKCGKCKQVCAYQKEKRKNNIKAAYAAATKDNQLIMKSTSGGIFAELAKYVLKNQGIVYGAALLYENKKFVPKYIRIEDDKDLFLLQGSKYVQCLIGHSYRDAKKDLESGKQVLFSGTPCQIDGFKKFLKKDYLNLLTVEIICHGVPNAKLFNDYISYTTKKRKYPEVTAFFFRDKTKGQEYTSRFVFDNGSSKILSGKATSYVGLFLKQLSSRINCYSCPYATPERISDITIGDFWGFNKEYPSGKEKEMFNEKAISCVLINTDIGRNCFDSCKSKFIYFNTDWKKISKHNEQLHSPCQFSKKRDVLFQAYKTNGYEGVEKFYKDNYKIEKIKYKISWLIPQYIKLFFKKILKKQ